MGDSESTGLMEPMLPAEGREGALSDMALELAMKSREVAAQIHPVVRNSLGDLVRSMNCYYSNLIEGHNTLPRDIDRAMKDDFSADPETRDLQKEARAHIEVQHMIDAGTWQDSVVSEDFIKWVHKAFYDRLPEELRRVENPDTGERLEVIPGAYRTGDVSVGRHVPVSANALDKFMGRFAGAYNPVQLGRLRSIIAVAASHHRLLWIHPFYDGNGRVARLFSHAFFRELEIGNSLWSVSRGLARGRDQYRALLMAADQDRRGDLDGRGTLSEKALTEFCRWFLEICIDQVNYMASLLEPKELLNRMEIHTGEEIRAGRLKKGSMVLLREALITGEFERGRAGDLTGYTQSQASRVLSGLVSAGLLTSDTPRGPVRLGFPIDIVERWFPKLYPAVGV